MKTPITNAKGLVCGHSKNINDGYCTVYKNGPYRWSRIDSFTRFIPTCLFIMSLKPQSSVTGKGWDKNILEINHCRKGGNSSF